jgi:hypothetical protein
MVFLPDALSTPESPRFKLPQLACGWKLQVLEA